ncbi:MAG TPA: hypothetical protein VJ761_07415 [Ktedonobacteraceae bacterium]|nr:hypothetical protein [Ktedonobacteraceae bacterium]
MSELFLNRAELLASLDAISARALVSISRERLFPADMDERGAVIERGVESLRRRKLLHVSKDGKQSKPMLNAQLAAIITTMAFPKVAIVVVTNDEQAGLRLLWFYQTDNYIVEHGFTRQKLHRVTELANVPELITRIEAFLAVKQEPASDAKVELDASREMDQNAFFTVKQLAEQHELEHAKEILNSSGFTDTDATSLLQVLERPLAAGNIAILRCTAEAIIDGRNLALLQDEQAVWSARQKIPGEPVLLVETTDTPAIKEQLRAYLEELALV